LFFITEVPFFYSGIPAFRIASKCRFLSTFFVAGPFSIFEIVKVGFIRITSVAASRALISYPLAVAMIERLAGPDAANALKPPFVLGETEKLLTLFQQASANSIRIKSHVGKTQFPSIKSMVEADLRGWLPAMDVYLEEDLIQSILVEAEIVLGQYISQDGTVEFDMPAHIITAIKPSYYG
jgi:hypothetical protein